MTSEAAKDSTTADALAGAAADTPAVAATAATTDAPTGAATDAATDSSTGAAAGALGDAHVRAGAVFVEREGRRVVASYGDASAEYEAVRGGRAAGLFDLSARGRVEVSGGEAVLFLNGLITNDVKALAPGAWMSAAFPNAQGRLLAFARVARAGEAQTFLFDTEPATRETVLKNLERFTAAGDFRVRDLSGDTVQLSVQGARAPEIVGRALGGEAARLSRGQAAEVTRGRDSPVTVLRATHTGEDGFDLIARAGAARELWDALVAAGARPCGRDALEVLRVEAGLPRHGADVSEANVVSEAGQDEAVSYTKGCYVGQEIIARIHWRGHVAKRLAGLVFEDEGGSGAGEFGPGAQIKTSDGAREIGRVTSAAHSPRLARRVALGLVKYDFLAAGTEVLVVAPDGPQARARVAALPLVRGSWHAETTEGGAAGAEGERQ
jgi:folate-binding protein YgfZ